MGTASTHTTLYLPAAEALLKISSRPIGSFFLRQPKHLVDRSLLPRSRFRPGLLSAPIHRQPVDLNQRSESGTSVDSQNSRVSCGHVLRNITMLLVQALLLWCRSFVCWLTLSAAFVL